MVDTKLPKVGITVKEPWQSDISYEVLDMTLFSTDNDGDGCSYVALKDNIGVTPGTDPTVWVKSTQAGQSIYDLAVKYHHFDGTEVEFEAQYQAALAAANSAASAASATNAEVQSAEALRVTAEEGRVSAESGRVSAESARVSAESGRATAETGRVNAESARVSAETTRQTSEASRVSAESTRQTNETARENAETSRTQDFEALKTDMQTAIGQADAATSAANAAAASAAQEEASVEAAEALRVTAEEGRVSAESGRVSAESARATAESGRATAETGRVNAESARVSAESGRVDAESARVTAEGARVTAEEGRVSAETAREAQASSDHTRAEGDHTRAESDHASIASKADVEDLEDGTIVPLYSETLKGWAERSDQNVESAMTDTVRTTGGDESINPESGATLLSIIATSDFSASKLIVSGFNLLRLQSDNGLAVAVGTGYYFPVPAMTFGTYGTAEQNNGVLFTDDNNNNLTPTVYFKALSDGVPTSITDGVTASYTDSNGKRFYTCSEPGYFVVSGITIADTCAHMAWSKQYDKFVSPTDENDGGTVIDLTALGTMRVVGVGANIVADRADRISSTQMSLTTNVGRTAPTWTRGTQDVETGLYPYTTSISGIKAGGLAEFEGSGKPEIFVDGTALTYYSESDTALSDYVKYQLATPTTANKNISTDVSALNDWGIDVLIGATGTAIINWQYAQGIPDALVQLLSRIDNSTVPVIAAAFAEQDARIRMLEKRLTDTFNRISAFIGMLDAEDYFRYTAPLWLECSATGAPAAARVPDNWDIDKMGIWAGVPRFIGQVYVDKVGKKVYMATAVNNSTNGWSLLN